MRLYPHFKMNAVVDPAEGNGGAGKKNEPDPAIAALQKQLDDEKAARTKADADFETYKKAQEREKMNDQQKAVADKDAAEKRAADSESARVKAEKKAAKATFGAELVGLGLKPVFTDTAIAQRKGDEDAATLAARLKANADFKELFGGTARSVPAAPAVPGGAQPKNGKKPVDEDEDERALKAAFPKDEAARKAAAKRLADQRAKTNGKAPKKGQRA